jgi:hypothetical protein
MCVDNVAMQEMWQYITPAVRGEFAVLELLNGYHKPQMVTVISAKKITEATFGYSEILKRPCSNWR